MALSKFLVMFVSFLHGQCTMQDVKFQDVYTHYANIFKDVYTHYANICKDVCTHYANICKRRLYTLRQHL
jgi:hypothetical protein